MSYGSSMQVPLQEAKKQKYKGGRWFVKSCGMEMNCKVKLQASVNHATTFYSTLESFFLGIWSFDQ